jgi:hypothetical protein
MDSSIDTAAESLARRLHEEARDLLDGGVRSVLAEYGRVEPMGSYALKLMAWRDLDVYVVRDDVDRDLFLAVGGKLRELLSPHKMVYRDELLAQTSGLPSGLYWGIYLGDERAGAWKLDVWALGEAAFEAARSSQDDLAGRISERHRSVILRLKGAVWQHPGYRKTFSSRDVYSAALDEGITDVDEFWAWIRGRGVTV